MAGKRETTEKKPSGTLKVLDGIRTALTWLLMLAAAAMMIFTVVSVSMFDRNDRDLFGYKAYIVRSDSMAATDFDAGDLVLVKEVDPATLVEGDIIAYTSTNPENFGETVTHKIRRLTTAANGAPAFVTYGTTTDTDDSAVVTYGHVLGRYELRLPKVGTFFTFLKTTPGYICCILLPFLLLILSQGITSIRLFRQYKAEQMAEIEAKRQEERAALEAERAQLAEERRKSEAMMAQLLEMKAAMEKNMGAAAPAPEEPKGE